VCSSLSFFLFFYFLSHCRPTLSVCCLIANRDFIYAGRRAGKNTGLLFSYSRRATYDPYQTCHADRGGPPIFASLTFLDPIVSPPAAVENLCENVLIQDQCL